MLDSGNIHILAGSQEVVTLSLVFRRGEACDIFIPYDAGRTAKDMWAYIRENGANKDKIQEALSAAEAVEQHDEL